MPLPSALKSVCAETTIEKIQYRQLHALHFEELNSIWEADRRIPSISSRRAWAKARNLNPTNVHNWWYRRRPLAKKWKIKIPRDEYDLDVGVPPIIPKIEEVNAEISTGTNDIPSTESSDIALKMSLSPLDNETSSSVTFALDKNPLFEELSAEMSAYTRSSSPSSASLLPWSTSRYSTPSRDCSPLPPSSPPSSPPACLLTFPEDMIIENYATGPANHLPDSIQAEHKETCLSTSYVPQTFSHRPFQTEASQLANKSSERVSLPLFPTWCLGGYRISYDGSLLGICSCFVDNLADTADDCSVNYD